MSAAPEFELDERYNYPVPPPGGWTAEDLDRLPHLPRRTELIDGSLVFMSPQGLKLDVPFPVDIDLTAISKRRPL